MYSVQATGVTRVTNMILESDRCGIWPSDPSNGHVVTDISEVTGSHSACSVGNQRVVMVWWVLTDKRLACGQMLVQKCRNRAQAGSSKGGLVISCLYSAIGSHSSQMQTSKSSRDVKARGANGQWRILLEWLCLEQSRAVQTCWVRQPGWEETKARLLFSVFFSL